MTVIAAVLLIVAAAPEYAEPAADVAVGLPAGSADLSTGSETIPGSTSAASEPVVPTSAPPGKLKGYRWPVRGGMVADYHDWNANGHFVIDGHRVHAGLVITWFEGALVKAAHSGTVVAAGPEWAREIGYDGSLDDYYERLRRKRQDVTLGIVIDDGNGYRSVYSVLQDLRVKVGDKVKAGTVIGAMSRAEGRQMMRYQLVRMDGPWMKVATPERKRGYPDYAREHVDPLVVLKLGANKSPDTQKRRPPASPPRLSDY